MTASPSHRAWGPHQWDCVRMRVAGWWHLPGFSANKSINWWINVIGQSTLTPSNYFFSFIKRKLYLRQLLTNIDDSFTGVSAENDPQVPYKYYSWEIATNLTKTKKSASSLGERLAEHFFYCKLERVSVSSKCHESKILSRFSFSFFKVIIRT